MSYIRKLDSESKSDWEGMEALLNGDISGLDIDEFSMYGVFDDDDALIGMFGGTTVTDFQKQVKEAIIFESEDDEEDEE